MRESDSAASLALAALATGVSAVLLLATSGVCMLLVFASAAPTELLGRAALALVVAVGGGASGV
jgi:hypothetical protein